MKLSSTSLRHSIMHWKMSMMYAWREVLLDFKQNKLSTLLSILVIAIALTLPSIVYLIWKNIEISAKNWYPTAQVTVYLDHSNSKQHNEQLVTQIKALPNVKNITYVSKEQSLQEFTQWLGMENPIKSLGSNPLPAVLLIATSSSNQADIHTLIQQLKQLKLTDIKVNQTLLVRVHALSQLVAKLTYYIAIIMLLSVGFIIANNIRMTIFTKQKSIQIMRLIGATEGFVLRPYLYQGALLGAISAIFSLCFAQLSLWSLNNIVMQTATIFDEKFVLRGVTWDECLCLFLITTFIGWLSAFVTAHYYVKKFP